MRCPIRLHKHEIDVEPPEGPWQMPNGKIVDEDGAIVDLIKGHRRFANGTVVRFAPKIDVHDKGCLMSDERWLKEGWTVDDDDYGLLETMREQQEVHEWFHNERPKELCPDVRDYLLRLRTSTKPSPHDLSRKKKGDGVSVLSERELAGRTSAVMLHMKAALLADLRPEWLPARVRDSYRHQVHKAAEDRGEKVRAAEGLRDAAEKDNAGTGDNTDVWIQAGVHVDAPESVAVCEAIGRAGRDSKVLRVDIGTHRWGGKLKFTNGETKWTNNENLESEDMYNCGELHVTGQGCGDAAVRGLCEGAGLWGEWKVYFGTRGSFENVGLFLETDNCHNPTLQVQGGNWSLNSCEVRSVLSTAILARDQSRLKIKHCLIGGFDRAWHQATNGIVAKGKADVRVKGGRIELLYEGVGVAVSIENAAQAILHQVVMHSAAIGVQMCGEARARVTKCVFRDLEVASLSAGFDTAAEEELWLADNYFYGPAPLWGGSLRPGRLVGDTEWHPTAPAADEQHATFHNGWVDCNQSLQYPAELEPFRIGMEQPWTEADAAYIDEEEARQLRKSEELFKEWGDDWKNIPDHDVRFRVRQRLLWRTRREQDRQSLEALAQGKPDPYPHFTAQRGVCWCEECATPEHLLPPQPQGGKVMVDPKTGCWAVPFMVDSTWEDLMFENEEQVQAAKNESILRMLDVDSVNITHFAESLAEYWSCNVSTAKAHLDGLVRAYAESGLNCTWENGERRLKKLIMRAQMMRYQSECLDPDALTSWESMMDRPIKKRIGQRIFNLDLGESSDEDYDGMRYEAKPMGVGWFVWNHTRYRQVFENKSAAQGGIMHFGDFFPNSSDMRYSFPDPTNPGPPQPLDEVGEPMTPCGGDTVYDLLANKYEPGEAAVVRPGSFPVRWKVGEEDQKHVDQQLHLDQFERSNIVERGGKKMLQLWEEWARANSSRPGEFDLSFASPIAGDGHPTFVPVTPAKGSAGGEEGVDHRIVTTATGEVPRLDEQQYLAHLWRRTCLERPG